VDTPRLDLGVGAVGDVEAALEGRRRQHARRVEHHGLVEAGARGLARDLAAILEELVGLDLDERARRAVRDAGLIAVGRAVVALRGDLRGRDLPAAALAVLQRAVAVEADLEELLVLGLEVDHLDRAVGARGRARGAAGARGLVDDDLVLLAIELDRVVVARVDAALVGAGAAGVDEVEHAQARAVDGQALVPVARLAGLFALLALDAAVDLAHAQGLGDREPVAHEEVEDLLLDAGDAGQAIAGDLHGAAQALGEEVVARGERGHALLREDDALRRRHAVKRAALGVSRGDGLAVEDLALAEGGQVLLRDADERPRGAHLALLLVERQGRELLALTLEDAVGEDGHGHLAALDQVDAAAAGRQGRAVGDDVVAPEGLDGQLAGGDGVLQLVVGDAVEERVMAEDPIDLLMFG